MNVGDVYFHNDVYLSEGGIGHLPDLCVTVPVFAEVDGAARVVAFVQAFGHHDDIGGAVPGSMPSAATSVRSEEHTSELQSRQYLVCRLLLEKKQYNTLHVLLD